MADPAELRVRIRELLAPGGSPLGEPGRSRRGDVRVVGGGLEAARKLLDELSALGELTNAASYRGTLISFGGEGRIGLREHSKSDEPTMDVQVQCVPEIRKIKFE